MCLCVCTQVRNYLGFLYVIGHAYHIKKRSAKDAQLAEWKIVSSKHRSRAKESQVTLYMNLYTPRKNRQLVGLKKEEL